MFREPEQLTEEGSIQEAAQLNTRPEQEVEVAYQKYLQTRQRIATIEEQLQTKELLWFVVLPASFWAPNTGVAGAKEELKMLQGRIDGQRAAVLHELMYGQLQNHKKLIPLDITDTCKLDPINCVTDKSIFI